MRAGVKEDQVGVLQLRNSSGKSGCFEEGAVPLISTLF